MKQKLKIIRQFFNFLHFVIFSKKQNKKQISLNYVTNTNCNGQSIKIANKFVILLSMSGVERKNINE